MRLLVLAAVAAAVMASGCAAKLVSSSPRSVVVSAGDMYVQEATNMAEAECVKHGRHARLMQSPGRNSDQFLFDCVN
ncbi:MAG: hypothetical protein V4614_14835 [Pseudomonadota bacterium]